MVAKPPRAVSRIREMKCGPSTPRSTRSPSETAAIVRDALEAATNLHEEADEKLAHYDNLVNESTRLRAEIFGLRRDVGEIPERINKARLDRLVPDSGGDDPALLERRYIQARERLPVATARIGKLQEELSSSVSGSRPAKVSTDGGQRRLVKHTGREPIVDFLNETVNALERLRIQLPDVVKDVTADLLKWRDNLRSDQNLLWGQAKAPK